MRNLLLLLVIGFAAYGAYTLWNQREPARPAPIADVPTPTPELKEPISVPKNEPAPAPEAAKIEPEPPIPAAPVKHLAPDGIFYVVQAFSVTTDDGVQSIRAGTKMTLVKDAGATLRVSDGRQEFDARREFLTNDLDIANQVYARQTAQQAVNAEWHQKQQAMAAANDQQKAAEAATSLDIAQAHIAINDLRARDAALSQEEVRIQRTISDIKRDSKTVVSTQSYEGTAPVGPYKIGSAHARLAELPALEKRLRDIPKERAAIAKQINALQR